MEQKVYGFIQGAADKSQVLNPLVAKTKPSDHGRFSNMLKNRYIR